MSKNFVVVKLNVLFTYLFTDHTLAQDASPNDPDTWKALMSKNFVVVKLNVLFTYLFTDHTLAQDVKMLKRHSWMVGVKMELLLLPPHLIFHAYM